MAYLRGKAPNGRFRGNLYIPIRGRIVGEETKLLQYLKLKIQGLEEYNGKLLDTSEEVVTPTVFMNPLFKQFMKATAPKLVKSKEQKLEPMNGLFFQAIVMCHEMAHVVTKFPRITAFDPAATKVFPEPYHSKEEMKFELPELGEPWECCMFDVCIDLAPRFVTGASLTKI
jgi:hypothetical protein